MKKLLPTHILFLLGALLLAVAACLLSPFAHALATPNHIMLQDGHVLTFGEKDCKHAIKELIFDHFANHLPPQLLPNHPKFPLQYDPTAPFITLDHGFDDMIKWFNITDIVILEKDWKMDNCTIYRDKRHGHYKIDANGLDVKATANWTYVLESKEAKQDQGLVDIFVKGDIDALIFHHKHPHPHPHDATTKEEEKDVMVNDDEVHHHHAEVVGVVIGPDSQQEEEEEMMHHDGGDDNVDVEKKHRHWIPHVFTFVNHLKLSFYETENAEIYNELAIKHNDALKWLLSVSINDCGNKILDHYLNPDHHQDDFVEEENGGGQEEEEMEEEEGMGDEESSSSSSSGDGEEDGGEKKIHHHHDGEEEEEDKSVVDGNNNNNMQFSTSEKFMELGMILNHMTPVKVERPPEDNNNNNSKPQPEEKVQPEEEAPHTSLPPDHADSSSSSSHTIPPHSEDRPHITIPATPI